MSFRSSKTLRPRDTFTRLRVVRDEVIDPKIAEHRGRLFKTTGDGLLVEFASVVDAVRCAVEVQQGMAGHNAKVPADKRIEFRIGVNLGDVISEEGDIYGDGVNVAARLESIARPGGIAVSQSVRDHVGNRLEITFEDRGEQFGECPAEEFRVALVIAIIFGDHLQKFVIDVDHARVVNELGVAQRFIHLILELGGKVGLEVAQFFDRSQNQCNSLFFHTRSKLPLYSSSYNQQTRHQGLLHHRLFHISSSCISKK
jgi:hypothetical protein